ncbi:MAG: YfhO family protein [Ruminiclostridium sp.]|nr:YfhO family protein [Ruminiclostridium sp.]
MEKTANSGSAGFFVKEYLGYARNGVKRFFTTDRQIWISFLVPCLTLLISYFVFGVFPFGKESVLSLDLNGQYVYYYDYMYDVFAGKESVFYSWSRNFSGEFMGIVGYYLASPFNLLVWAWPRECITEGLLTMMVTKVGAIGLCTAIYLSKRRGFNRLTTVIFSTCYALCAYTLEQTMNPMWLDGVMILPLVVYGVEELIDNGRFIMCTVSLVYAFVTCFYIGYMIGIFSAIYFLYYACVSHREKLYRVFIQRGLLFTGVAVVSVMMSAFMLLPVYHSLSYGKFDFSENVTDAKEITTNFHFIEMLDKMFPATYDTCRMSGLPFIYCGTIVLIMLPCFFFMKKIRGRDRIGAAVIISVLCVSMYIRQIDMLWHGGQLPNWLPYRYSFMLTFLMVTFAAQAFNEIKDIPKKRIGIISLVWFVVLLMIENTDNYLADIKRDTMDGLTVVLPAMLVLLLVSAALVQLKDKLGRKKSAAVILCVILSAECFYNTIAQIFRQDQDIVYSTRASYNDVIQPAREVVQGIKEKDDGFYRIEKTFFRTVNDPMALNMYGLSHSSSTLNAKPIKLLSELGFSSRSHYTRYSGATEITKSLFGVKYELSCPENSTAKITSAEDITVTENEYALPMAYLVHPLYQQLEVEENDPFENQNKLLSAMIGDPDRPSYFKRISNSDKTPVTLEKTNVTQGKTTDGHHSFKVVEKGKNAELVYTLSMPATSSLYMYLPSKYERTVNVWLNRKTFLGTYFENDNNSIMKIGDFKRGEEVKIGLTLTRDDLYFKEAQFVYINERNIRKDLQTLIERNKDTYVERTDPTTMKVSVSTDEPAYLFTSIPEEKGWEVFVDGQKTDYDVCLGALLTVPIMPGNHTVEFRFTTAGYPLAVIVSLAGLALFIGMIMIWNIFFRPRLQERLDLDLVGSSDSTDTEEEHHDGGDDGPGGSDNGGDDNGGGEDGEDNADDTDDEDDEESGLLDIFQPKGNGSEWLI